MERPLLALPLTLSLSLAPFSLSLNISLSRYLSIPPFLYRWTIADCRVLSRGQAAATVANQSVVLLRGTVVGGTATRPVASRSVQVARQRRGS